MATFTYFYEIFSAKLFCNMKVAGPGEIFVQQKFPCVQYSSIFSASSMVNVCGHSQTVF